MIHILVAILTVVTFAEGLCAAEKSAAAGKPPAIAALTDEASGRVLLGQFNCTACHAPSPTQAGWIIPKTAPRLADIGARASADWIQRHLISPQTTLPGTMMPDLLHGLSDAERASAAESLTQFLLSRTPISFKRIMPDRAAVARGDRLYHRVGCVACHAPQNTKTFVEASAPLPNMTEKWAFDGLRRFLVDPPATRPCGRMPSLKLTDGEASNIAHYLLRETHVAAAVELEAFEGRIESLDDIESAELVRTGPADDISVTPANANRARALRFNSWLRVDQAGDYTIYFSAVGAARLSIDGNAETGEESWQTEKADAKIALHLSTGWHAIKAEYVHRGSRPGTMTLEWEGPGVARQPIGGSFLRSERDAPPEVKPLTLDDAKVAAGRVMYEKLNCAACHEDKRPANTVASLSALHVDRGCLAEVPAASVPDFHLAGRQCELLRAAVQSLNDVALADPSPKERVAETMAAFNCNACHSRDGIGGPSAARDPFFTSAVEDAGDEGRLPPRLDGVGDKLLPAWLDKVLADGASVRPALYTRMPQFGRENVGHLTSLFVELDRRATKIESVADAPDVQKEAGRKMAGTNGLSCIVCHRFNRQPAQTMQMIDMTTTTERLNQDWFNRFLLDPARFHPATRMPALWPDEKSSLPDLLGGDTSRQHAALWAYLSDGPRAKFPEGLSRQNVELVVGGEAIVYRGKLWEAGFRAVAIGYPGQVNAAFDAEEMRLSLLWRGRFLDAGAHWKVQGMGQIHPLGTNVAVLQHGSPLAVLADADAPWPAESAKALGMKFRGYQLDSVRRPTLLYSFGKLDIEDFLIPIEGSAKPALRRTITFADAPPDKLYFRVAAGRISTSGENGWRLNDTVTLSIKGGGKPIFRGKGNQQELLIPIHFAGGEHQVEVEYAW